VVCGGAVCLPRIQRSCEKSSSDGSGPQKYFRKGRKELNWPEGASSRESVRAVVKMYELQEIVLSRGRSRDYKEMVELVRQVRPSLPALG